jgi:LacI family transcriptional regulator, galactose operon repressor
MAVGAAAFLADAGIKVPDEVALTGFDDIQLARYASPPLTTVRQPMRKLGEECVRLLLRRLEDGQAGPQSVELETQLVVRRSCGCSSMQEGGPVVPPARAPMP